MRRRFFPGVLILAVLLATVSALRAQVISTFAGGVVVENQPATATPLSLPRGIAVDLQGNLYIAETAGGLIRKVDAVTGIATIIAGGGTQLDDARPIPARQALLDGPTFPAVDALGNVYFCDTNNHRIRKITPDGMITTVVGTGLPGFSGDGGLATRAQLNSPEGLYLDAVGNLFISDSRNNRVRRVEAATGVIQTIAGGGRGGEGSKALEARLDAPIGVTQDRQGNIFLLASFTSEDGRAQIVKIDRDSRITTTVAGGGTIRSFESRVPLSPKTIALCGTHSVAVDEAGNVYFDDCGGVMRVSAADGLVRQFFGASGGRLWGGQVVVDASGAVLAADPTGQVLRGEVEGRSQRVAGTLDPFDGLFATTAPLGTPRRLALDAAGNLFIADHVRPLIRRVDARTGIITTVVRNADPGDAVHVDRVGNLIFAANGLKKLDAATGQVTTLIPGAFGNEFLQDGMPASEARLSFLASITLDAAGNIFFVPTEPPPAAKVWMLEAATGLVRLVAGNGTQGASGDGGPAKDASLSPADLALDGRGNLLIAHHASGRLRQVNLTTGIISSIPVELGGGQSGVAVDARGNIYVSGGNQVGVIVGGRFVPVAGSGQRGFFGDGGIPTLARLSSPQGLAVDADGSLYIADSDNARVRKVTALTVVPILAVRPTGLVFTIRQGQPSPSPQALTVTGGNLIPLAWTAEVSTQSGGNWLAVSPSSGVAPSSVLVAVNPANLAAGIYTGAIRIVSEGASGSPQTISVTLTVQSTNPPAIGLSQQFLSFAALQGGANPPAQSISLTNTGGGVLSFAVQTETSAGGAWLQVTPTTGTAPTTLTVRASSSNLASGQYQGLITIRETNTGEIRTIAVSLLVSQAVPILQVSQTGLLYLGVEGSLTLRPQSLTIQNRGQGVMSWRVATSVPGGGDWLKATPDRGTSDAANPQAAPTVTVTVDPTPLRAGVFTGLLIITADGAPNSPFVVLVLVNMLAAGTEPVGLIQPAGLIFTTVAGATAPLVQEVTVSTTGGRQLQFLAGVRTQSGGNWLSLSPTSGTLLGSTESVALQLTANPRGLAAGVYVGVLTVSFGTGLVQDVAIALVVSSVLSSAGIKTPFSELSEGEAAAEGCAPSRMVMVETRLVQNFQSSVGWPIPLLVQMVNDCAEPVPDATVLASFSNGDPSLLLNNLRNGLYSGTWSPTTLNAQVTVTLSALHPTLGSATVRLSGALAGAQTPILFRNGAVNGASFRPFAPLGAGSIFSIFGRNLERVPQGASALPLPVKLGDISVKLGELDVPLIFVGPEQINAQVPYELPTGTTASLVVRRGELFTTPEVVTIVAAQPAIFSRDGTGTGQGAILDVQNRPVDALNPAAIGEVVQIFATGLGITDPKVASGAPAPASPLARVVTPATVTIGGREAVVEFAGLVPGFAGLYQVNARVPPGVAASSAVPVVITQNSIASNTVILAVR